MTKGTMQEAKFLILTALSAGSQHGYGIIADVAGISDGRVRLRAGTLYTALDRLREDRLLEVDRERSSRTGCVATTGSRLLEPSGWAKRRCACRRTRTSRCRGSISMEVW